MIVILLAGCAAPEPGGVVLDWHVFDEPSGAFERAAERCSSGGVTIAVRPLPASADQQREQLVRRLAAGDPALDLLGLDVIWIPELAAAGWLLPFSEDVSTGRIPATVQTARWDERYWAVPFTTNTQLLWYRTDRVSEPPPTWDALVEAAEAAGGTLQVQGGRYEGLTVWFTSLLASAGGRILDEQGQVALADEPTRRALEILRRVATSPAADPALPVAKEDEGRRAFEAGGASFMVNYGYVWPSAHANVPELAGHMAWAPWPRVEPERPARVTLGGLNLGVAASTPYPELARQAALCLASEDNQRLAAVAGGLPPTLQALYDDPEVRRALPFADTLRDTLRHGVQRPATPLYTDVSLALQDVLHPLSDLDPERDVERLRRAVGRALRSEGLW